ncbi:MAG TPA: phosphoribosylanthranilate isomerase [Candidatus Saccharimonadales bacterium]|nr:phosphoribosylanthranilate isomerase [Candidatus Saccharimonadales bacterium]
MRVKICGLTRAEDAQHAARCGADLLGLVAAESPRRLTLAQAAEVARVRAEFPVRTVGVFHRQSRELILEWIERVPLDLVQVHPEDGTGWPVPVILTRRLQGPLREAPQPPAGFLLYEVFVAGRPGGTGQTFPAEWLESGVPPGRYFLAGGLTPENVAARVRRLRPFGVDVSGGVERSPGVKDPERVRRFIEEARHAELG